MSTAIQFAEETFRPICIQGNATAAEPVEFDICAVGGAGRARLKSIIDATSKLQDDPQWTPEIQESVIKSFETGPGVFAEGITAVRGLTAPAALCLKRGLISELPKGTDRQSQIMIRTGYEYSLLCGFWPVLSFEVALAIARVSAQAEIDPRFFAWLSTLQGISASPPGTVARVPRRLARRGIAGSKTKKRANSVPAT